MKNKFKIDGWFIIFVASIIINIFMIIENLLDIKDKSVFSYHYFSGQIFNPIGFVLGIIIIPILFIFLYKIYKSKTSSIIWTHIFFALFILRHSIGVFSENFLPSLVFLLPGYIILYFSIINIWIRLIKYLKEENEQKINNLNSTNLS